MSTVFRWLHLSDFHQGQPQQSWLWPAVKAKFLEDLARLHKRTGPWDLILFTGDLVNRGLAEEFSQVASNIETISQRVSELNGANTPHLLAVPGNHDLARPDVKEPAVKLLVRGPEEPECIEELFSSDASQYRRVVKESFKGYLDWWQQQPATNHSSFRSGLLPGDFSTTIEKHGTRLGIIGLNSSAIQLAGGDFQGKLYLHPRQVQAVCDGDAPKWMRQHHACLLLTHHPPSWLHSSAQKSLRGEIAPAGLVAAHLFGHTHEGGGETRSHGGRPPIREWQAYSLFGMESHGEGTAIERRHGYCVGEIRFEGNAGFMRRWPRRATQSTRGDWTIHADHSEFALSEDEATSLETIELLRPIEVLPSLLSRSTDPLSAGPAIGTTLSPPPIPTGDQCQDALVMFRRDVSVALRYPHLASLETDETARLLTGVTLDELYVVPTLHEERVFVSVEEETRALHAELDGPDLSKSRRQQIKNRLAQLDHLRWTGQQDKSPPEPLTPDSALSRWQHWVVLGTPGAGKSTLLHYLALRWADDPQSGDAQRARGEPPVPLLIYLREYAAARRHSRDIALDTFLLRYHAGDNAILAYALRDCFAAGQAVVLLDALDEVPTDAERQLVSRAISAFLGHYPKLRCIITSRPYGYQPLNGDLVHLRLSHLTEEQIEQFVHQRQRAIARRRLVPDLGAAIASADQIVAQVKKHSSISELARNPLLLLMICDLCQRGQKLPVDRAQLYERAIRTLLQRWNQWHLELQEAEGSVPTESLTEDALFSAFSEVARLQQRSSRTRPVMTAVRLQRWLGQTLVRGGMDTASAQKTARAYVQAAAGRAGLLEERGPQQFVFWHQTFQEYLAATALMRNPKKAARRLQAIADRPRWHEVVQLALAHVAKVLDKRRLANRLVLGLMTEHRPPLDGATLQRLCLASSCVAHNPWIDRSVADRVLISLSESLVAIPVIPLASAFEMVVSARSRLVPSEALSAALVDLCDQNFGYIGNTDVRKHAARIMANGTKQSQVGLDFCDKFLSTHFATTEATNTSSSLVDGDLFAACRSAALGLLRAGRCTAAVLTALTSVMREDDRFIEDVQQCLKALHPRVEPILDSWLSGEGPSLDVAAAVLLSLLDRHDDGVIDALLRELGRDSHPFFDSRGTFSLLHWHARVNKTVRGRLLGLIPTLDRTLRDNVLQLFRSLVGESDEVLGDVVVLLGQPNSEAERLLFIQGPVDDPHDARTTHRILEHLSPLLNGPDSCARFRAAVLVAHLDAPEKATAALLLCVQCDVPDIQLAAIMQLLGVKPYETWHFAGGYSRALKIRDDVQKHLATIIQCLKQLVQDNRVEHCVCAALLLVALRNADDEVVVDALSSAEAIRFAKGEQRLLGFEMYPEQMTRLAQRMADHLGNPDAVVRGTAESWLSRYSEIVPIEILRGHLGSPDEAVRLSAARVLLDAKQLDPTGQLALVDGLRFLTGRDFYQLSEVLQHITEPTKEAVERLTALLMTERIEQKEVAPANKKESLVQSLASILDAADLLPPLIHWMSRHAWIAEWVVGHLIDMMLHPQSERNLDTALSALSRLLAAKNKQLADLVAKTIAAHLPNERNLALLFQLAERLFFFGLCRKESKTALHRCLDSTNLWIRFEAAGRLCPRSGKHSQEVEKALVSCLESSEPQLRMRVLVCLFHHRIALDAAIPHLNALLAIEELGLPAHAFDFTFMDPDRDAAVSRSDDESSKMSDQAVEELDRSLRGLERRGSHDTEAPPLCVLAAGYLCKLDQGPEKNPTFRQTLLTWLAHPNHARKIRALRYLVRSVAWAPDPSVDPVLLTWLDDTDELLRKAAARILFHRTDTRELIEERLMGWLDTRNDEATNSSSRCAWGLFDSFSQSSDRLLRWLLYSYVRGDLQNQVAQAVISNLHSEQLDRFETIISEELPQLTLPEASVALEFLIKSNAISRILPRIAARVWVEVIERNWRIDNLFQRYHEYDSELQESLLPYLADPDWWRRERVATWLLARDYDRLVLAQALRPGLSSDDPEVRFWACCRLEDIGLSQDRPLIVRTIQGLMKEAPSVYETSERLDPFGAWPEFADVLDRVYAAELAEQSGSYWDRAVRYFLARPQHKNLLLSALLKTATSGHSYNATQALDHLCQLGIDRRLQLKILLGWLTDGNLLADACRLLAEQGLLSAKTDRELRMQDTWGHRSRVDRGMSDLLTLAKDPLVPLVFAEILDADLVSVVERCANGRLQPGDEEILAKAVRSQAGESLRQSFARCWLYYWLCERARSRRVNPVRPSIGPML